MNNLTTISAASGEPILLLRLEGPLQSWGTRARWDMRDTAPEPTKSGIVGLLGCALGYATGDPRLEQELDAGLRLGVRVEAPGHVLEDFHTVTDFLLTAGGGYRHSGVSVGTSLERIRANPDARPATILSPRFYLEDAAFLVALSAPDDDTGLLSRCADALRRPCWSLFLGRKACPATRPIFDALTEDYADIVDALRRHPWSWLAENGHSRTQQELRRQSRRATDPMMLEAYVEDSAGPLTRQDAIRTNAARVYGFRQVRRLALPLSDVYSEEVI